MLILAAIITVAAIVLDQVSKALVVSHMALYEEAPLIPHIIRFYHTRNTGAAFSMLSDHPWVFLVLSTVAMIAIVILLYKYRDRHILLTVTLSMILGGGIGNMIDRVVNRYVVDFLDFEFVDFAVFNVADIFVTCGSAALAVYLLFIEPKVEARERAKAEAKETEKEQTDDGDVSDR